MKAYIAISVLFLILSCCNGEPQKEQPTPPPAPREAAREFDYTFEAQGGKFGTYLSSRYGPNDIWLAHAADGGNYRDLFTGCALMPETGSDAYTAAFADGKVVISYERAIKEATDIEHTRFVATLAQIERDSDGDGLPDLVEYRFRTNATSPDTDGDGSKDGEDTNPLASGRAVLTERQEIWKAAFEQYPAKYPDRYQWPSDAFIMAVFHAEADFFELPGRKEPVLTVTLEGIEAFAAQIGYVLPQVCFEPVSLHGAEEGKRQADFEMDVLLGPLRGERYKLTLEKQDDKWKLTGMEITRIY